MGLEEKLPSGFLLDTVENLVGYMRKDSLWPATFGLACCAIEMMAIGAPRYDLARFGMEGSRLPAPGRPDDRRRTGQPEDGPGRCARSTTRWPSRSGSSSWACARSSGGMFNNYAIVQGVDHIVPVDIYLPGCPPRPEMLINAILELHQQIQSMPLGVNRTRAAEAAEAAALTAVPTSRMKGLLA